MTRPAKTRKKGIQWRKDFGPNEVTQRVRPEESSDYLPNPHRGTTTFQRFQGDPLYPGAQWRDCYGPVEDRNKYPGVSRLLTYGPLEFKSAPKRLKANKNYIPWTTISYCRWPWRWLEPKKGKYNWKPIEGAIKAAKARGQTLQIRFQPFTEQKVPLSEDTGADRRPPGTAVDVPDWYWDTGAKWIVRKGADGFEPDHNDSLFVKHFGSFIRAFAKRYDGHPTIESIDVAYAGHWGECGGNSTKATAAKLVDIYLKSFRKTQLLSMLGTDGCTHAAKQARTHVGWRADCFGDLRFITNHPDIPDGGNWTHMYEAYPMEVVQCGLRDAWKVAPVTMESCGTVFSWDKAGYDFDWIIEQGYKYHTSIFMPKSVRFPDHVMDKMIEFDKRIGYRFVMRQMRLPLEAKPGSRIKIQIFVENVGCAPIYRPYQYAYRFRQGRKSVVVKSKQDIRTWMPGNTWFEDSVVVPAELKKGVASVDMGIVDSAEKPVVWFAIKGSLVDGWHPMTHMDILNQGD